MKPLSLIQTLLAMMVIAFCSGAAFAQDAAPMENGAPVAAELVEEQGEATVEPVQEVAETAEATPATSGSPEEVTEKMFAKHWQLGMRAPASPVQERIFGFHHNMLWLITAVTVFVLILMVYVCVRFSEKNNPNPSKTSHNTMVEIVWTLIPVLILVAVAIPSLRHLYFMDKTYLEGEADLTVKVVGYQWYWNYEYPDHGFAFDSYMVHEDDLKEGQPRLLAVDNAVVVPVGKKVLVQLTAGDVIHSWAMPNFGVKMDAVPGRLNETWFQADHIGTYYGQCSELCGVNHGFMPITVHVVSEEDFEAWIEQAKDKFAASEMTGRHYAALR